MEYFNVVPRLQHAWNAFMCREPTRAYYDIGPSSSVRPDRPRFSRGNENSIITAILNQISVDASSIEIKHVRTDDDGRYVSEIKSGLNSCLNVEANIDQAGRAFRQDIFMSILNEGVIGIFPVDTDTDPDEGGSYKIETMRTAAIRNWYPRHVRIDCYNDRTGEREELDVEKRNVAIVENPFYAVMNERNSILKRLNRKLILLDAIDEQSGSGKLDLIIQLPYSIRSDARQRQADSRKRIIEEQLQNSKHGIAYIDASEKVTQLNRPVENNLMTQIEYLTSMLYSQLGLTQGVMDGTADEATMQNYYTRTIEPLVTAVVEELLRKFLTPTARTQKQTIMFFRDPFKLVPTSQVADIADKMTRNEVLTSNEVRQIIGRKPSKDPKADELRNKNLSAPKEDVKPTAPVDKEQDKPNPEKPKEDKAQNGE